MPNPPTCSRLHTTLAAACIAIAPGTGAQAGDALFDQVFGKRAARESTLAAETVLDGRTGDAVDIGLAGDRITTIDAAALAELLSGVLVTSAHECLLALGGKATAETVTGCGVAVDYDPASLQLRVEVPTALRKLVELPVQRRPGPEPVAVDQDALSAYLNTDASVRRTAIADDSETDVAVGIDGAFRWRGVTLEFDGACQGGCSVDHRSLVVDRLDARERLRVGDLPDARAGAIGLPSLRGVGWGTNFDLAPLDTFTPAMETQLELSRASSVEVLLGDRVVQRFDLAPGRYNLTDFPLAFGENAALLRITDDTGRVETRRLGAFVDLALLAPGLSRHGIAVGRPLLSILDDTGTPVRPWTLAADYARGLGPRTTISAAGASIPDLDRHLLEARLTQAVGGWLGAITLGCATGGSTGCQGDLQFRRGNAADPLRRRWQVEGAFGWRDRDWRDLFGNPGGVTHSVLLRASRPLTETWFLGLGATATRSNDRRSRHALSAQITGRPFRHLQLRLGIEHRRDDSLPGALSDTFLRLGLTIPFDRSRQSLAWSIDGADDSTSGRWQFNRSAQRGGFSGTLGYSDGGFGLEEDAGVAWNHQRIGADFSATRSRGDAAPARESQRLSARTALVYANGALGMAERVDGGFAIITPVDPAAGPVYVNPVDDDYLASSAGPGPAVVGNLRPYEPRALALALPQLPADREAGELFPVVVPGYKGGVRVLAGGQRRLRISLRVVDADGKPQAMVGGRLIGPDPDTVIPVFVGRDGSLRAGGLTPGKWQLVLDTRPERRHAIQVADSASGVVDLGDLPP